MTLEAAFDLVQYGVVLLDKDLKARLINTAFRRLWRVPDALASRSPSFRELLEHGWAQGFYTAPAEQRDAYIAERLAQVQAGSLAPGRSIRSTNPWRMTPNAAPR